MSLLKERRVLLLILLITLSIVAVWRPWAAVDPRVEKALGEHGQFVRGLHFSMDIIGGASITLRLEASHVTIRSNEPLDSAQQSDLVNKLKDELLADVKEIAPYDRTTREVTYEIGRTVTKDLINSIIDNVGEVVKLEMKITEATREEVMHLLQTRTDPYGLLGVRFRALGDQFVLFEVPGLRLEEAIELLGRQGRLETFIENTWVFRSGDIVHVGLVERSPDIPTYQIPLRISEEGAERFENVSKNKAGYPFVIYLDRPADAILLFDNQLLAEFPVYSGTPPTEMNYDNVAQAFLITPPEAPPYHLQVTAISIPRDNLPDNMAETLQKEQPEKTRVIFLKDTTDFSPSVVDNIAALGFAIENLPRMGGEATFDWIMRACGWRSDPIIAEGLAGTAARDVRITVGERSAAEALRTVLVQRLPVGISFESMIEVEEREGRGFLREVIMAGLVALVAVGTLIYLRYRRLKIVLPLMMTMICEVIIILGVASIIGWSIGVPEIGGIIAVVGTGADHQIIITDEVLRGAAPSAQKVVSLKRRVGLAFSVIFVAAATTLAAMASLAYVGFGIMRGFAIVTIIGLLASVLVTRPVYARIISTLLAKEAPTEKQLQA